MMIKRSVTFFVLSVLFPLLLIALPQDQEIFIDFESVSGEDTIFVGEEPNVITLVGFTVETLEDPAQLHSGTKALTLGPGQEGRIVSSRGIQFLEFYAAETTGGGKFEIRGQLNLGGEGGDAKIGTIIGDDSVIEGLPTNISPGANPPLYSFVADSGVFLDEDDFNFLAGITEVKFLEVTGKLVLDDLGFTLTEFPSNNTVYTTFDELGPGEGQLEPLIVGTSPNTASFDGGLTIAIFSGNNNYVRSFSTAYAVFNGGEATITFETPAYEVDFFGAQSVSSSQSDPDGSVEVYDTNDNLLATFTNLDGILRPEFKPSFLTINAVELGAPGGIKRLVLKDDENINPSFSRASIDDFGFTPIGAPGTGSDGPPPADAPAITSQPASQEVAAGASTSLSVASSGNDLTYQWYTGNSGDTAAPVPVATGSTLDTGALTANTNFWVQITNASGSADSDTAVITVAALRCLSFSTVQETSQEKISSILMVMYLTRFC